MDAMIAYFATVLVVLGIAYGLYRVWHKRVTEELAEGAAESHRRLTISDPALLTGMTEERFCEVYSHTNFPRFPAYLLITVAVFLIGTPFALTLLAVGAWLGVEWGIVPQPGDVATELYFNANGASIVRRVSPEALSYIMQDWGGFYYFFGLLGFWLLVGYLVLSRYHRSAPGTLREEILRAR